MTRSQTLTIIAILAALGLIGALLWWVYGVPVALQGAAMLC